MTDKQLEEYTRLKIQEATKELQDKYDKLNSASKEYKTISYGYLNADIDVIYHGIDELTVELKGKHEELIELAQKDVFNRSEIKRLQSKYEKATEEHTKDIERINNFKNSSLLTRIGIAIRGEL